MSGVGTDPVRPVFVLRLPPTAQSVERADAGGGPVYLAWITPVEG